MARKANSPLACIQNSGAKDSDHPPVQRNEAGLINIDNIQLWAGLGVADVDKVQLWLLLVSGWAANEEIMKKQREHVPWVRRRQQRGWHEEYGSM